MKKETKLQKKASNNLVNIPTLFVKDLGWKDKDVLTVEYKNGKIIITKED
jgi:antitoxin component of MazEF toxin-antitoxin module